MLSLFKVFMSEDVSKPLIDVLYSGNITQGKQVEQYEKKLKEFFQNDNILTLNSATAGLTLGIKMAITETNFNSKTDLVLSPALTCFATTAAILANNVNIKWLDIDSKTCNICLTDLKNKLNRYTKIVMIVHWGGYPVDLDKLDEILEKHKEQYGFKPIVVEDCAHAFGSVYKDKMIGNHGNICVFSTQAIKHLTTGDGGFIILPNKTLYERCKLLRWYGIDREKRSSNDFRLENDILESGYKFHMNDINATIGLYNLPHIQSLIDKNRYNYSYLRDNLKNIDYIELLDDNTYHISSVWLFTIKIKKDKTQFIKYMNENNIMTSQVHNRNDINSCVKDYKIELPNLDKLEKEIVCIPVGWWLNKDDLDKIILCISYY